MTAERSSCYEVYGYAEVANRWERTDQLTR